jgi:hypothetical protein
MIHKLVARRYLNDWNKLGMYCGPLLKVVTLALKFKFVVIGLSIHICICVQRCTGLWL